jgi:alkanesulfonate monooxygenase SsuD/methylene tetrahydromethanopterin reductase-like flavin-dependent oxidoreductase (luciferase family)
MITFGLDVPATGSPMLDPAAEARRAEALGFDFVSSSDHPSGTTPSYEAWTMITWMAAATTRISVLPRVLGVPFRNPALVAKMAETLGRLAGGRLILGLGGGASDGELRAFGQPVPSPRDKIDGLAEAIEIARGLWTTPALTYPGRIYRTEAAPLEPKPARPVPIWVGTFGPRALAVTGRLADGWIPSLGYAPPNVVPAMLDKIRAAAAAAGRDIDDITRAYLVDVRIGGPVDDPATIAGSPEQVADRLVALAGLGFTAFNLKVAGPDRDEQLERLAREVVPLVREGLNAAKTQVL